jgi:hypothetical protein
MKITAIVLSAAMLLTPVAALADEMAPAAAPTQQQAALAPGAAAGIHQAQSGHDNSWTYVLIGAAVVGGVIWAVSGGGGGHHHSTPSTNNP